MQTLIRFPAVNDGFFYGTKAATNTKRHLGDICQQNLDSAVISICNRCLSTTEAVFIAARRTANRQHTEINEKRERRKITERRGEADSADVWTGRWDVIKVQNELRKEY